MAVRSESAPTTVACHSCGENLSCNARFCRFCGAPTQTLLASAGGVDGDSTTSGGTTKITRQGILLGGRFVLEGIIGTGGMGMVYRALDLQTSTHVAVKLMRPDLDDSSDGTGLARFLREARQLAVLRHCNLVEYVDAGLEGDHPWLVTEYLDGAPLNEILRDQRMSGESIWKVMEGLLAGLGYLHENGFIHRDIKPANLFLTRAGEIKLLDLGLIRPMGSDGTVLTALGRIVGTATYMAPEQCEPGPILDSRVDIYAAGCVLYQLITGRPPISGDRLTLFERKLRGSIEPPSTFSPEIAPALNKAILAMLALNPGDRISTARECLEVLEPLLGNSSDPDGRPTIPAQSTSAIPGIADLLSNGHSTDLAAGISHRGNVPHKRVPAWLIAIATVVTISAVWFWVFKRPMSEVPLETSPSRNAASSSRMPAEVPLLIQDEVEEPAASTERDRLFPLRNPEKIPARRASAQISGGTEKVIPTGSKPPDGMESKGVPAANGEGTRPPSLDIDRNASY